MYNLYKCKPGGQASGNPATRGQEAHQLAGNKLGTKESGCDMALNPVLRFLCGSIFYRVAFFIVFDLNFNMKT